MTVKISDARKGTELDARVFGTWQSQVNRAIRELQVAQDSVVQASSILYHLEPKYDWQGFGSGFFLLSPQTGFGQGVNPPHSLTITGARFGATVLISWGEAPDDTAGLPPRVYLDAWVQADDLVSMSLFNYSTGLYISPVKDLAITVFNPPT